MMQRRLHPKDYTVGWVCALPIELAAAAEMLDEEHQNLSQDATDTNSYTLGRIGEHDVVIACLPAGQTGTNSAAAVAVLMKSKFTSIRFGLLVGIGGGVPSAEADIRLGDVVISQPHMQHGGVIQYDFGKTGAVGHFTRTGFLNTPPTVLLNAFSKLQSNHYRGRSSLSTHLSMINHRPHFAYESVGPDILFKPTYNHIGGPTCDRCSRDEIVERTSRGTQEVVIHCGTIASGNQVMKDGLTRDRLSSELGGILCFEMEAAGLMNSFPCLVIRGICDYADSHKNKSWQPYAAATAAACAKELLSVTPVAEVARTYTVDEAIKRNDLPSIPGDGQHQVIPSQVVQVNDDLELGQALLGAAKNGATETVTLLLDAGANINYIDKNDGTTLQVAALYGQILVVQQLLKRGADPNLGSGRWCNPIIAAIHAADTVLPGDSNAEVLRAILKAKPNLQDCSFLAYAAERSNSVAVEMLLDAGTAVNSVGPEGTALQLAALYGRKENFDLLLKRGADPNIGAGRWENPLVAAIHMAKSDPKLAVYMVQELLERGADRNTPGILHYAVWQCLEWNPNRSQAVDVLRCLLAAGVNVNALNANNETALYTAAFHGAEEAATVLFSHKADSTVGKSPLVAASSRDHTKIAKLLMSARTR